MKRQSNFDNFIQGFGKELTAQLKLQFYHDMMIEHFSRSRERQKIVDEVTAAVLSRINLQIHNEAEKTLKDLLDDLNNLV